MFSNVNENKETNKLFKFNKSIENDMTIEMFLKKYSIEIIYLYD